MKIDVSIMALICLNQPLFSKPLRKASMEGFFNSHTTQEKKHVLIIIIRFKFAELQAQA